MSPIRYPKPPSQLTGKRWWKSVGFLGPGIIIASVSIGTGETIFASRGGAIFGYAILWCFTIGLILKCIQIYASSRYMMISGEHPMQSWMMLPGPRGWLPIGLLFITVICLPFLLAALSISVGSIISWMFGSLTEVSVRLWATGLIIVAAVFSWNQTYQRLEKTQTIVVGVLLVCVVIAAIACQPDLMALIKGMLVPTVPSYQDWIREAYPNIAKQAPWIELVTYIGIIGGGLPAYIGYFGFLRDKKWGLFEKQEIYKHSSKTGFPPIDTSEENQENNRIWLRAIKIDVGGSFLAIFIFSSAFMVLGAVILHSSHLIPDKMNLLIHQEKFLTSLSPYLLILYRVGIISAIGGTLFATFDVWTKSVYEGVLPLQKKENAIPEKILKKWIIMTTSVIGIGVIWIGLVWEPLSNPITIVSVPALLGGTTGCGIWCLGVAWADRRNLPQIYRMNFPLFAALIFSGLVLLIAGILGFYFKFIG
ncbi:MAG: Nramp family divalent metal transporter [Verrucomicrobia bacterium]|nr:Nramp family divalent metal transporter [Verrucomicrobiota bacterium]